jgi:hypothetical protein
VPTSRRRCQAGAGRLGIDIGGKPLFAGLDAAAAGSGDAWAGFWPASASAAWSAAAGHLRRVAGLIAAAETTTPRRAAPALSLATAIETVPGLEQKGTAVCLRVPIRLVGTWIDVFCRLHLQ